MQPCCYEVLQRWQLQVMWFHVALVINVRPHSALHSVRFATVAAAGF